MSSETRQKQDTLPLLTTGRSSAEAWLNWINQMGDVNMLLLIAKALNEREDAVLPPADGRIVEMGYSREDLISYALKKVVETSIDSRQKLLKRLIPFEAYDIKTHLIDEIINEPLDNKDDKTVSNLLQLGEFLAVNPEYLPVDIQMKKIEEIFRRLQEIEGIVSISGEIRGSVERVTK